MKTPRTIYNWLSLTGFVLAANSLILILILFLFSIFSAQSNTYLGLYIYIILPAFLVLGLILIPLGILFWIKKKETSAEGAGAWPIVDLNQKKQRGTLI